MKGPQSIFSYTTSFSSPINYNLPGLKQQQQQQQQFLDPTAFLATLLQQIASKSTVSMPASCTVILIFNAM